MDSNVGEDGKATECVCSQLGSITAGAVHVECNTLAYFL